ncbi:MAG: zinc ribbon domain-containing protein [Proteobacteria bacterium]|nr:zinc ribbon domain-containing protein [Pseudomonadota bacterium]
MPIYEFYCDDCNTIFSFFSRRVNTATTPLCPKCGGDTLSRRLSRFAVVSGGPQASGDESGLDDLPLDENQLLRAMSALEGDMGRIDESDPRSLAQLMRKFSTAAGMEYGEKMEDMLRRLERGEDPEALEKEMGDLGDDGDIMDFIRAKKSAAGKKKQPRVDDTLYEM